MKKNMLIKFTALIIMLTMCFSIAPAAMANETLVPANQGIHIHDDECKYDIDTHSGVLSVQEDTEHSEEEACSHNLVVKYMETHKGKTVNYCDYGDTYRYYKCTLCIYESPLEYYGYWYTPHNLVNQGNSYYKCTLCGWGATLAK